MAESYIQRYIQGEHEAVWTELTTLGQGVRNEPILQQAEAVAEELVRRATSNIEMLLDKLHGMGYCFQRPEKAYVPATQESRRVLDGVESRYGQFPILLRKWYETIDCVDFTQSQEQLTCEGPLKDMGWYPQLCYRDLHSCVEASERESEEYRTYFEKYREIQASIGDALDPPEEDNTFLPLGPCASNCELMGFWLPSSGIDAQFYDDGGGPKYFSEHIRMVFACGGFPQLKHYSSRRLTYHGMDDPDGVLQVLLDGLESL